VQPPNPLEHWFAQPLEQRAKATALPDPFGFSHPK
jgi:hypothetical protein